MTFLSDFFLQLRTLLGNCDPFKVLTTYYLNLQCFYDEAFRSLLQKIDTFPKI